MNTEQYVQDALRTASTTFHSELVPMNWFNITTKELIIWGERLDKIKKSLFYGKPFDQALIKHENECSSLLDFYPKDLIHGIIGIVTEAVELLQTFQKHEVDKTNIKEEIGDLFWYCAILANECGFTFEDIMQTNIDKLRARYPNKFTEYDAINRNLDTERKVLENENS